MKDELTETLVVKARSREGGGEESESNLTFAELRLASMLHIDKIQHDQRIALTESPDRALAPVLADMVIQVDRLAAAEGIDLAAAVRARFDPE